MQILTFKFRPVDDESDHLKIMLYEPFETIKNHME
jgi:hypothetical protein